MKLQPQIKMTEALFLRNPEASELEKEIINQIIQLIYKNGFEAFTLKKLAEDIGTTEAQGFTATLRTNTHYWFTLQHGIGVA